MAPGDEGQVGPATLRTQTDVPDYRSPNLGPKLRAEAPDVKAGRP